MATRIGGWKEGKNAVSGADKTVVSLFPLFFPEVGFMPLSLSLRPYFPSLRTIYSMVESRSFFGSLSYSCFKALEKCELYWLASLKICI